MHGPHRAAAKIIDFGLSAIRRADEEDTDFLREAGELTAGLWFFRL